MDAGYGAFYRRLVELLVNELVTKVDSVGILLGVSVVYAFHACPIECAKAHGTRLAGTIHNALVELECP